MIKPRLLAFCIIMVPVFAGCYGVGTAIECWHNLDLAMVGLGGLAAVLWVFLALLTGLLASELWKKGWDM